MLFVIFGLVERLDEGQFHPKLEIPRIEPGPPRWETSTLTKSYSNNVLIATVFRKSTYLPARDTPYYPFSEAYHLLVFF
jgi:hypothetical protein